MWTVRWLVLGALGCGGGATPAPAPPDHAGRAEGHVFRGYADADGDGVPAGTDCDDTDASVYPGATEVAGDGVDQDCDGVDLQAAEAGAMFAEAAGWAPAPQACADTHEGCWSNQTTLVDLDGDGRLDVIFANGGGYYVPGEAEPLVHWRNTGSSFVAEDTFGGWTGRLRQVAVGDLDGDGDLDLVAPDSWALQPDAVFLGDGAGGFVEAGADWLGTASRAGAARLADVDGDLDLDLFLSDWGESPPTSPGVGRLYLNTGARFEATDDVPLDLSEIGTGPIDADFLDVDGDWDLDLLLASRTGDSILLLNDGAGRFADADAQLPAQKGPYVYGPDACDVDGDGDLDLWLDNGGSRQLVEQLLLNDGAGWYVDATERVADNPAADDNEVQCADVDGDGDFDAVVASLSDEERVLLNDGTGGFTLLPDAFPPRGDGTLGLDLGDVDGDGRLDAVTGQGETGSFVNRVYLGTGVAVDTRPPVFRAVRRVVDAVDVAVSDGATSDVGPRVQVYATDGTPAVWRGGDLYRVAAAGEGSVTVCADDGAQERCVAVGEDPEAPGAAVGCGCVAGRGPAGGAGVPGGGATGVVVGAMVWAGARRRRAA